MNSAPSTCARGRPILYTSADSVLQIAAHENVVPLKRLYEVCSIARRHADAFRIGRVIARPFVGESGAWKRTSGRHDFSMLPPRTVLNAIDRSRPARSRCGQNQRHFRRQRHHRFDADNIECGGHGGPSIDFGAKPSDGLIFANLVDFDMLFGHRRDVAGYAQALAEFDAWLAAVSRPRSTRTTSSSSPPITATIPTWHGTDHTREEVPLLVLHQARADRLGTRLTFADVAASLAAYFQLPEPWPVGTSTV